MWMLTTPTPSNCSANVAVPVDPKLTRTTTRWSNYLSLSIHSRPVAHLGLLAGVHGQYRIILTQHRILPEWIRYTSVLNVFDNLKMAGEGILAYTGTNLVVMVISAQKGQQSAAPSCYSSGAPPRVSFYRYNMNKLY